MCDWKETLLDENKFFAIFLDYVSCLHHKGKLDWLLIYKNGYEVGK
jgi:hypothetical protein